jgi:5'-deoxynucleotidase YfbR-like HD superfamily hydrolase
MLYRKLLALEGILRYNHHPRLRQQSVAAHSFNVALITSVLCKAWGYDGNLVIQALWHDYTESITGDVSPLVKRYASWGPIDTRAAEEAKLAYQGERLDMSEEDGEMHPLVKLADYLDAWMFAQTEVTMGNELFLDIRDELNGKVLDLMNRLLTPEELTDGMLLLRELFEYNFLTARTRKIGEGMSHV